MHMFQSPVTYLVINTVKLISLINFAFPLALPCERHDTNMKTEHYNPTPHPPLSDIFVTGRFQLR